MNISRQEIADAGMVTKGVVDKAISRGTLKEGSLLSIVSYIIASRLRSGGIQAVTGLCPEGRGDDEPTLYKPTETEGFTKKSDVRENTVIADLVGAGMVTRGCGPTHHDYETSDEEYCHAGPTGS